MGSGATKVQTVNGQPAPEPLVANLDKRNREIEQQLARDRLENKKIIKILLLGGPACGKSTIFKQMKILHMNGFKEADFENFRRLIHINTVQAIEQLLRACESFEIELDAEIKSEVRDFWDFYNSDQLSKLVLNKDVVSVMTKIWHADPIKKCYERRSEFNLLDAAKYFLDDLNRITAKTYIPSNDDILHARIATTGIHEIEFKYLQAILKMVDVGGQKSEQRKWIHCFDGVDAILFIVDISGYDQAVEEDVDENRVVSSLELFHRISRNIYFQKTAIILFLNKVDRFTEKLPISDLRSCFSNYQGASALEEASKFLEETFVSAAPEEKPVYAHFTTATDTRNIEKVFAAVMDVVIKKNMQKTGLLM